MTNDGRDWPRNREQRMLFAAAGRSRSVGSFRSPHGEPSGSRLREPRLSIGAGIRDLERRTADVPIILRTNINNVIEELRPIVERARSNTGNIMSGSNSGHVNLASWLGTSHQPAITGQPRENNASTSADEVVIDIENPASTSTVQTVAVPAPNLSSPTQSVAESEHSVNSNNSNTTNNNNNNGSGDEQEDVNQAPVLSVSNSVLLNTICKYVPFILLIFTKFILDNIPSILQFIGLSLTFYYYNGIVKREVANQTPRTFALFLLFVGQIAIAVAVLAYIIWGDVLFQLWYVKFLTLGITPQQEYPENLGELLWTIIVTDYILKLITVILKAVFTMLPQKMIPSSKRGKWYLFIEASSQVYRNSVPIQPWLHYLLESYEGPHKVVGVFLSAMYMVSKGNLLMSAFKLWWMSFMKVLRNVTIGGTPTKEQIASAGNLCSICHDEFKTPVILECQHIFCEMCVTKWLDREQTCPLCRAKIADDPSWRDGSTTYFIMLF